MMSLEERFWAKVKKSDGCWEWQAACFYDGYGQIKIKGMRRHAHRVSFEFANGKIPKGLLCLHHCDNKKCVRPDHLFLGTYADNVKDMISKNRARYVTVYGEHNGRHRLKAWQVLQIREAYQRGESVQFLHKKYHTSTSNISFIGLKRGWCWLDKLSEEELAVIKSQEDL